MMVARLSTVWMSVLCETRSSCFVSYADIRNFSSRRKEKKKKKKEEERNFSNITINITNIYVYINVFRLIKPVVKRYRIIPMSVWQFHRCPLIGCRKAGNQWFAVNRIYYIYIYTFTSIFHNYITKFHYRAIVTLCTRLQKAALFRFSLFFLPKPKKKQIGQWNGQSDHSLIREKNFSFGRTIVIEKICKDKEGGRVEMEKMKRIYRRCSVHG